jgi:hypothetical protein
MNRKVLIEGYQPEPSKEDTGQFVPRRGKIMKSVAASALTKGPNPSERLPKTNSSISIPKK